jgi:hypothetical protein
VLLNVIDIVTTYYIVDVTEYGSEWNPLLSYLINTYGTLPIAIPLKIVFFTLLIYTVARVLYKSTKREKIAVCVSLLIINSYYACIMAYINIPIFFQAMTG